MVAESLLIVIPSIFPEKCSLFKIVFTIILPDQLLNATH